MRHLYKVLTILEEQSLFAKESKCEFGMTKILYLGHIINARGVQVHQEKIRAIIEWPTPKNLKELRVFRGYAIIINNLLKAILRGWQI